MTKPNFDIKELSWSVKTSKDISEDSVLKMIHDLAASSTSFMFLAEELEAGINDASTPRQITKAKQIRAHADLNAAAIAEMCAALSAAIGK